MTTICHNGEGPTITSAFDNSISDSDGNSNRKYSLSDNFSFDLGRVLDGTFPKQSGEVYVGETSNFLADVIGASVKTNIMPSSKRMRRW